MSWSSLAISVVLICFTIDIGRAEETPPQLYDCGTTALYHLLRLEGRPADLIAIDRHLIPTKSGRRSMSDLRNAALALGLRLEGVKLPHSDKAPSGVALVHLDRKPDGHFLLIRPVGVTGKLVQVIDSVYEPFVMDATILYGSPEWTGLALVPLHSTWPGLVLKALAVVVGVVLLRFSLVRGFQSHRLGAERRTVDRTMDSEPSSGSRPTVAIDSRSEMP